jgi:hypothetical protein
LVTVSNVSATHGQVFAASSLFTASDLDGDPITQYDFWDTGTGGGHFVLNNQALNANQNNYVSAAQLAQTTYQSGSGPDTVWVRVSDGTQWSPWSQSFTVTGPVDTGPTVTPANPNISATHNQSFAASSLFAASDPFGDPITQYDFWDTGTGGGHFVLNNQALNANQNNYVSAAQLAQATYQSGSGADTLWVRVSDGHEWSAWSPSFTMTAPIDTGPVVDSVSNIKTMAGQIFAASNLFTASDPFGDAITQYDFWNTGMGGGHFIDNGQALGANQDDIISAAQLAQTTYQAGSGTDTLWVRVNEGGQWSAWSPGFTVSDPPAIGSGETLELASGFSGQVSFAAPTGVLKLLNSASFVGTVAGMSGQDTIDFNDIDPTKVQGPSYSGTASGGTLTVTDGSHTAKVNLLGNYLQSSWSLSKDGSGGTLVVDPPGSDIGVGHEISNSTPTATSIGGRTVGVASGGSTATGESNGGVDVVDPSATGSAGASLIESNGRASVDFGFTLGNDQIKFVPSETMTQSYGTEGRGSAVNQIVSVSSGGPGGDSFVFHPVLGADTTINSKPQADMIEPDHLANVQSAQELASLIMTDVHGDAVIEVGQNDHAAQIHAVLQSAVHLH